MQQRDDIAELEARLAAAQRRLREQSDALQASEARYRALFEHSPDMVLMVDPDGLICEANLSASRRLGDPSRPLVGQRLHALFETTDDDDDEPMMNSVERQHRLTDGRVVQLRAAPVPGSPPRVQVVLRDMTGRQHMEDELARTRRLAAVGHLAAGVAHEINNPLTVMQLRVDLLREQTDAPEVREQLHVVREHIGRVARIVQNLQTFARPVRRTDSAVSVVELLRSACELAAPPLAQVNVRVHAPPGLSVQGDRGALEQVFVNLLVNAAEAVGRRGNVDLSAHSDGATVVIDVHDDGPGVPAELRAELFTPFTSGSHRTGLGLAIAWSLVHEHGGSIVVRDPVEGGACFTVTLPAAWGPPAPIEPTPDQAPSRVTHPTRDLVLVDDDEGVAEALRAVASELGYRVIVARTAAEALRCVSSRSVDVVLADVQLPGMSGRELLDVLRDRHPLIAVRTILMSGLFLPPEEGVRYVQKPFSRGRLAELLRSLTP